MNEHPVSLVIWDAAKEAQFSLAPSRVLNHELYGQELEEAGREIGKTVRGH